jgi:RHS repeat-associated protein
VVDWVDYGARFYDPVIARWTSIDPMAAKYNNWSPYVYCNDNPVRFFDFEGGNVTPAQYKELFLELCG